MFCNSTFTPRGFDIEAIAMAIAMAIFVVLAGVICECEFQRVCFVVSSVFK
tara:strand:- start:1298 stop:1450 length:153 start_codon:yes stop_codon:yes gene_type:complete